MLGCTLFTACVFTITHFLGSDSGFPSKTIQLASDIFYFAFIQYHMPVIFTKFLPRKEFLELILSLLLFSLIYLILIGVIQL